MVDVAAIGNYQAKVLIVGDFPTAMDLFKHQVFSGSQRMELENLLQSAGLAIELCYCTYVIQERVPGGDISGVIAKTKSAVTKSHQLFQGKYVTDQFISGVENLKTLIHRIKPYVVCTMGDLALLALLGQTGSGAWRSSIMESTLIPGLKVIPTYPLSRLVGFQELRPIVTHDLRKVAKHQLTREIPQRTERFIQEPDFEQARDTLEALAELPYQPVGADIETKVGHIACISFAWSADEAICIPFINREVTGSYWSIEQEAALVLLCLAVMRKHKIIGQNWNYDSQYIHRHWNFVCTDVEDTMIMHHSCFSNMEKNLGFLSSMYSEHHVYWKDENDEDLWLYNNKDSARTLGIYPTLQSLVKNLGMQEVNAFQQELRGHVLDTMLRGIRPNHDRRQALSVEYQAAILEKQAFINSVVGYDLNTQSPLQMTDLFYTQLKQRKIINRKSGSATCDESALLTIASREPILAGLVKAILELRSLKVFLANFIHAKVDPDGKLRTTLHIAGTITYRFASTKTGFDTGLNMQNVPSSVRDMFLPDPDMTIFDIDLDSADLQIVAWESDCKWLKAALREGRKPYIEVMKKYYNNPEMSKKSHPKEYGMFKSLCHGTHYLGTAEGIAPRIGLDVKTTAKIQDWYFSLCPEIKIWQEKIKHQIRTKRFVQNVFGYRTYFFQEIKGTVDNEAIAWIPQSSVACLINRIYVSIARNLPNVQILAQVHDSLVGQYPTVLDAECREAIVEASKIALPYDDPLTISIGIATSTESWGGCRG